MILNQSRRSYVVVYSLCNGDGRNSNEEFPFHLLFLDVVPMLKISRLEETEKEEEEFTLYFSKSSAERFGETEGGR